MGMQTCVCLTHFSRHLPLSLVVSLLHSLPTPGSSVPPGSQPGLNCSGSPGSLLRLPEPHLPPVCPATSMLRHPHAATFTGNTEYLSPHPCQPSHAYQGSTRWWVPWDTLQKK